MSEELKEFKECTKELTSVVHSIDKKLAISIQQTEDFFANNTTEHTRMTGSINHNSDVLKEHNGRLRKLEKWKYGLMGGLTVVMFLIGWLYDFIKGKF